MKHLPKHLRPRWRYLGVGIESWMGASINRSEFQRALWYAAGNLLGDTGSADADLSVYGFDHDASSGSGAAIVRVRRGHVDPARAAIACLARAGDDPVGVRVRGVSGTVQACKDKHCPRLGEAPAEARQQRYLGRAGGIVTHRDVTFDGADRQAILCGDVCDIDSAGDPVGATKLDIE
ncbi:MAG: ribonuclease P protein subunit Rpp14 [uncultured archaeon A07HR60]|nr:MAG: ribonuclease P protein subunit Rpp14 [uncultured archaeon A07HR60]